MDFPRPFVHLSSHFPVWLWDWKPRGGPEVSGRHSIGLAFHHGFCLLPFSAFGPGRDARHECDLRKRFSLDAKASNNESRIIVVEVGRRVLRFVVDRVNEVLRVIGSIVEPAPALASGVDSPYVRGVGKLNDRLLILLDLNRLFLTQELHTAEAAALPQAA